MTCELHLLILLSKTNYLYGIAKSQSPEIFLSLSHVPDRWMIASRSVQYLVRFIPRVVSGMVCGPVAVWLWALFCCDRCSLFVSQVTDQHGPHGSCNKTFLPPVFFISPPTEHSFETVQAWSGEAEGNRVGGRRLAEVSELLAEARRQRPPRLVHYNVVLLARLARARPTWFEQIS
jgi:hypothetical protein